MSNASPSNPEGIRPYLRLMKRPLEDSVLCDHPQLTRGQRDNGPGQATLDNAYDLDEGYPQYGTDCAMHHPLTDAHIGHVASSLAVRTWNTAVAEHFSLRRITLRRQYCPAAGHAGAPFLCRIRKLLSQIRPRPVWQEEKGAGNNGPDEGDKASQMRRTTTNQPSLAFAGGSRMKKSIVGIAVMSIGLGAAHAQEVVKLGSAAPLTGTGVPHSEVITDESPASSS